MSFEAASARIKDGKLLHIAGAEALLRKLPKGRWIGGSTEYFMTEEGGKVSGSHLYITEFPYEFSIQSYGMSDIENVASDAYDNGFSILIIPFDSALHIEYANSAAGYRDMFFKNIAGWISGVNMSAEGQTPVAVNGMTGEVFTDKAVALHMKIPADKTASISIVNIFSQDEDAPVIEFTEEGFLVKTCLIDGKETSFADYITQNNIDTRMPLVGDYSGNGVNIGFRDIIDGVVRVYSPVFPGIRYRAAKRVTDYVKEFNSRLTERTNADVVFSCNCLLNFLYGELEGKSIEAFYGPITFGEIAYQLVNQTLVYVSVLDK
jgi:hypothetical protein